MDLEIIMSILAFLPLSEQIITYRVLPIVRTRYDRNPLLWNVDGDDIPLLHAEGRIGDIIFICERYPILCSQNIYLSNTHKSIASNQACLSISLLNLMLLNNAEKAIYNLLRYTGNVLLSDLDHIPDNRNILIALIRKSSPISIVPEAVLKYIVETRDEKILDLLLKKTNICDLIICICQYTNDINLISSIVRSVPVLPEYDYMIYYLISIPTMTVEILDFFVKLGYPTGILNPEDLLFPIYNDNVPVVKYLLDNGFRIRNIYDETKLSDEMVILLHKYNT